MSVFHAGGSQTSTCSEIEAHTTTFREQQWERYYSVSDTGYSEKVFQPSSPNKRKQQNEPMRTRSKYT